MMSNCFDLQVDLNLPSRFIDPNLYNNKLFDFNAISKEVNQYQDVLTIKEHFNGLLNNDNSLYIETASKNDDNKELSGEEDRVIRANSILLQKIKHLTSNYKLKGIVDSVYLGLQLTLYS